MEVGFGDIVYSSKYDTIVCTASIANPRRRGFATDFLSSTPPK